MTLTEGFVKDQVYIDFGADVLYGSDQAYISYPCRFPTVRFMLMATNGLVQISDRIRKDAGYAPLYPMDEYTDETCDGSGWYDYFVEINGFTDNHMGSCIEFVVANSESPDNEELYTIDLGADEQAAIFNRLDEQCREHLGKGCEELLAEAEAEMKEEER